MFDKTVRSVGTMVFMVVTAVILSFTILLVISIFISDQPISNKCLDKALTKGLINRSKTDYKLAGTNINFRITDWGDMYYGYWSPESPDKLEMCEARAEFTDSSKGVSIIAGYTNESNEFVELSTIQVNIYAYAQPEKTDPYEFERIIQSMVNEYNVRDTGKSRVASYEYYKPDLLAQKSLTGKYRLVMVDNEYGLSFPILSSNDNGLSWGVGN